MVEAQELAQQWIKNLSFLRKRSLLDLKLNKPSCRNESPRLNWNLKCRKSKPRFRHRHYAAVGHLYAQLDELEAKIANARAQLRPEEFTLMPGQRRRRATESAAEAGLMNANSKPGRAQEGFSIRDFPGGGM